MHRSVGGLYRSPSTSDVHVDERCVDLDPATCKSSDNLCLGRDGQQHEQRTTNSDQSLYFGQGS